MKLSRVVPVLPLAVAVAVAVAGAAAEETSVKGADLDLIRLVRSIGERIANLVGRPARTDLVAVRAEEPLRAAAARERAQRWLPPAVAAARGRAWGDLGFGGPSDPADLATALALDLAGMTFDASNAKLLVDPTRLTEGSEDADASLVLATGVAADEPVAGHYVAHVLTDEAPFSSPPTTDAMLARAALAEGTANVAAMMFLFGGVGLEAEVVGGALRPEDALGGRLVSPDVRSSSAVVGALVEFVYLDGFAQAAELAKRGDFRRLLGERKLRRTTRDLIHLDRQALPAQDLTAPRLPEEVAWPLADRDALGEQGIVVLVSLLTGKDNLGLMAGDGWVADALWRFEPTGAEEPPGRGVTFWTTRWTNEDEAKDFAYALERCFQGRFPGETMSETSPGIRTLSRPDRVYKTEIRGLEVHLRVADATTHAAFEGGAKKKGMESRSRPRK